MQRSPLTKQYQRVMSLVEQLHALAEDERNFILDLLVPLPEQPEVKKPTKRASVNSSLRCKAELLDGSTCHMVKTHGIHAADNQEPNAHKFLPKKSNKSASKSPRASGMAAAISNSLNSSRKASQATVDAANDPRTIMDRCGVCGNDEDYQDHFKPSPNYHKFDAGKSSLAQPVRGRSSTNGGATNSTASSEDEMGSVGIVAREASGD